MKNKSLILLIIFIVLLLMSCGHRDETVTIFSDGKTSYSIVIAEGAPDDAKTLASELASTFGVSGGVTADTSAESSLEILIGDTNRAATADAVKKLQERVTASAFHYLIAESDGKLVILSDADIGYYYALEYIKETYLLDASFTVTRGICDIHQVLWDDYYSSELYLERLYAAADKNRYEAEKDQFNNEVNRYEDNSGNSILTISETIEQYKTKLSAFSTDMFGEYTKSIFEDGNKYQAPTAYPTETHPRLYFTSDVLGDSGKSSLDTVRENLTAAENAAAYKKYMALSDIPCDGNFKSMTGNMVHNYDADIVAKIEAKAFRFIMERDAEKYPNMDDDPASIYGYEAIYAAKNAMLTIYVPHSVSDWCRTYGYLMYVTACVYDWCYELMSDLDKAQLIAGCVNLLGTHLEVVCFGATGNKVPTAQGTIYGHGAEDQILVDYLSFAIACFDEAPEIYELVGGRVLNDYVEAQSFMFEAGVAWEGSYYGPGRSIATLLANIMIDKMTNGTATAFTDSLEYAAITATFQLRPDGTAYRIGDIDENFTYMSSVSHGTFAFLAGNFYGNTYLKSFAYEHLSKFTYFANVVFKLSAVQFLSINDPDVSYVYDDSALLTQTTTYPTTTLYAKSSNDEDAFSIYMTMPELYAASHAHMECGSFQIYYKGILASDSGAYDSWGGTHHMGYNMQTISSNSLLIYNPSLKDSPGGYASMIYSGGQSTTNGVPLPDTLSELKAHAGLDQCVSLGTANVSEGGVYLYSYMGGDMTAAYDDETVSEVTRYMFAVATGDSECPYAVLTFDRITSLDSSYHKAALIHVQDEPTLFGDYFAFTSETDGSLVKIESGAENSANYAVITNGGGKLIVQSVGFDTEYTVIGGAGREFWIYGVDENGNYSIEAGKNLPTSITLVDGSLAEYGWGRIEISPKEASETNLMLTVMYVTDAENNSALVSAANITSENLAGAQIFGKAVLFPKNEKLLTEESTFTLTEGGSCFIAGVSAGTWQVLKDGALVAEVEVSAQNGELAGTSSTSTNLLTFDAASAGTYTIRLIKTN